MTPEISENIAVKMSGQKPWQTRFDHSSTLWNLRNLATCGTKRVHLWGHTHTHRNSGTAHITLSL